jgi:hypothetical protein
MEEPRSPRIIPNWLFIRSTKSSVSRNQSFVLVLVLVVVLESAGKLAQNRPVNSKFFDNARGSAIECVACLDASAAKGFASSERTQSGKEMSVRMWPCSRNWSSALILTNTGCARMRQA